MNPIEIPSYFAYNTNLEVVYFPTMAKIILETVINGRERF